VTATIPTWTEQFVEVAGGRVQVFTGGAGPALLVLHDDIGNPGWQPFHARLAERFSVVAPSHPGWERSDRPAWARSVRDLAAVHQWLLAALHVADVSLVGFGLGGWIAAEMASLAPRQFHRLVLVGAAGIQPPEGEIFDQSLLSTTDYVRTGLHDPAACDRVYGAEVETDQLEQWEINREMTFRIAWKPYLYSQTLPHLLGGVQTPVLILWGDDDRIVPRSVGERYQQVLPNARLEIIPNCGHHAALEQPDAVADRIIAFAQS
jgi:pimeloyl-ACP methyl ester carboxylesterase